MSTLRQTGRARRQRNACVALALCALGLLQLAHGAASGTIPSTPQGHYVFRSYGPTDGLVNTAVNQLVQDAQGFIWAGTDDGLYRYDGYRFDAFGVERGLPSANVDALHEDRHGTLWVATHGGLSRWNGIEFETVPGALGAHGIIRAIADDADGIWLASANGLHVGATGAQFHAAPGFPGGEATALATGRKSTGLWVGYWNDGRAQVLRYDAHAWRSYVLADSSTSERIDALAEDGEGRIWARSATQLWALNAAQQDFERIQTPIPLNSTERGFLSAGRRGDLWVSTNDLVMHRDGEQRVEILSGAVLGTRPVLEDREGSLWFGTRGLQRLAGRGAFHAYDITEGLPGNVVWSIVRDREQTLWVGTEHGLARAVGEHFEAIPATQEYALRSVVAAPDGKLYMAGIPAHDVLCYDPSDKSLRHIELGVATEPTRIFHLALDHHGVLWATTDNGLLKADTRAPQLRFSHEPLPNGTATESVRGIYEDGAGRLWVAGQRGLAVREDGHWQRLTVADGLPHNEVRYVRATRNGDLLLAYDSAHGFDRLRYAAGKLQTLRHFDAGSTRYIDEIFIIGEDANDNVWIGTGRGIDLYSAAGTEHFSAQRGLIGEDTAGMSFLAEPDGDVWFGVVGGLMRFDARLYRTLPPRVAPPAELIDLRLGEQRFAPDAHDVRVLHDANSFQVRFTSLSFISDGTVQYKTWLDGLESTYNITESHEARYPTLPPGSYRFEVAARAGAKRNWGAPATFSFVILPAWWQTWWARTLFGLGVLVAAVLALRWRLAALERRNRLLEDNIAARTAELSQSNRQLLSEVGERLNAENAVQQRNAELEALNQKLAGTQSQLLQSEKMASVGQLAAGVAHEINNPIGFVYSNLNNLRRYVGDIFEVLRLYERLEPALPRDHPNLHELYLLKQRIELEFLQRDTAELLIETLDGVTRVKKIVQDLKDFSHVDEAEWQRVNLHHSLDSTLNVVAHELKYKADLVKHYDDTLPLIECLPFQINQVLLNLLMNAVHAIEGRGTITIRTGHDDAFVWASISDTGKGIDPAIVHRIFEPFFTTKPVGVGTGLGLSVSYGIIQKHGGSIEVESAVGQGSTFTVRLPIDGKHHRPARAALAANA